jgi:hypothetical protein
MSYAPEYVLGLLNPADFLKEQKFKVAESNYSSLSWHNPDGMVPWERTIDTREVSASGNRSHSIKVIDFRS